MSSRPNLKADLEKLFKDFRWTTKGFIDENNKIYPLPDIPQVITGIFQEVAKKRIKPFLKENYNCEIIQGGSREYPEITAFDGKIGEEKIAIDIKTTRRISKDRISGFSIGSYAGYFLHPNQKLPGCKFPYAAFKEHWLVGFIYTWNPNADSLHMVSDIEVIVEEKWKIASKSTATGTTFAISSVRNLNDLRERKGDFNSSEDFENFWRAKGLKRESDIKGYKQESLI
jgi:hypothetical protein